MKKYEKSIKLLEESLKLYKEYYVGEHHRLDYIYKKLYESYRIKNKLLSEYYLSESSKIQKLIIEYDKIEAQQYLDTASNYWKNKEYKNAINYFYNAIVLFEDTSPYYFSTTIAYQGIIDSYLELNDNTNAINFALKAHRIAPNLNGYKYFLNVLAISYFRIQDYEKSFEYSIIVSKDFLERLTLNTKREYIQERIFSINNLLISAYKYSNNAVAKKQKIYSRVFNNWLNYKGSIYDSENEMVMLYENTKDKSIKDKIDTLNIKKRQLAKLYQTIPKPEKRERHKLNINNTEVKIANLINQLAKKVEAYNDELGLRDINYKDISKKLKDKELYIDFAQAGKNYYIFTLDKNENINFVQIDEKDTKNIDKNIKLFREDIDKVLNGTKLTKEKIDTITNNSKSLLSKLYTNLVQKPLKDQISQYDNLIISSDGALRLLPFEALYDSKTDKYLIENKNIRYVPSGKELIRLYRVKNRYKTHQDVVIFSNPNFNDRNVKTVKEETIDTPNTNRAGIIKSLFKMRFVALPGTKEEVKNIKETLNAKNIQEYAQNESKEENLLKVNKPKILHIATHGFFINDDNIPNPMLKSGIALSGANVSAIRGNSDGIVTSLKLSGLNLKGTELVVLSACQTGVVDIKSTENVSGLNKAFIQAGAQNIVMSLWSVADKETSELMSGFYKEMQNTPDYAEALKNSKLKMIKQDLHPFYWGAFVLSGR